MSRKKLSTWSNQYLKFLCKTCCFENKSSFDLYDIKAALSRYESMEFHLENKKIYKCARLHAHFQTL